MMSASVLSSFSEHVSSVVRISQSCGDYAKIVASVGEDRNVLLFDYSSNEVVRTYKANNNVYDMQFSPSGDKLSLATMDSQVYLMDIRI